MALSPKKRLLASRRSWRWVGVSGYPQRFPLAGALASAPEADACDVSNFQSCRSLPMVESVTSEITDLANSRR